MIQRQKLPLFDVYLTHPGARFPSPIPATEKGQKRFRWLLLTLQAIIVPITASRTSNLLRAIETLFGVSIAEWRYYTAFLVFLGPLLTRDT